jgi:hypothetical protein
MKPVIWRILGQRRPARLAAEEALLRALLDGAVLKVHRTVDGAKVHQLHCHGEPPRAVEAATVRRLEAQNLIQSNMKFPAATYLLTEQGAILMYAAETKAAPLTVRTVAKE